MKRILILLFAAMLAGQAWAQTTFEIGDLKYVVTDETNHYVTAGQGSTEPTGALSIPSTVTNGGTTYTVTSIGNSAFAYCSGLTSVIIPTSVSSIGDDAFDGCNGLTSVTIPNSVTSIGDGAFWGCNDLTSVTIPNSVIYIGNYVFVSCSKLIEINIESGNTAYTSEEGVLFNNEKNNLICYPAGKTGTTYTIPNSVTSIGENAFYGCSGLTSVTIPNSVTSIGEHAFFGCSGLAEVIIPNSVTSIGEWAFYNCKSLTSITIPNSVKSIGDYAFYDCNGLTEVIIGNSVISIGRGAFEGYSGLKFDEYDEALYLGNSSNPYFALIETQYSDITSCNINENCKVICDYAFFNCIDMTSVTIPNSITSISRSAFEGCSSLMSVTIPESVTSISDGAFNDCRGLTSICYEGSSEPTYQSSSFTNVDKTISVCVPADYSSDSWCGFTNLYIGHDFKDYTYNNDATTDADGTETATCSRCGATDTKVAEGTKLTAATAVSDEAANAVNIYAHGNTIVVENATEEIFVYDVMGQLICKDVACRVRAEINVNVPGGYIVKTGNVTKRVMVF
jgi:Flp pilus assembly protein protease CpaA